MNFSRWKTELKLHVVKQIAQKPRLSRRYVAKSYPKMFFFVFFIPPFFFCFFAQTFRRILIMKYTRRRRLWRVYQTFKN